MSVRDTVINEAVELLRRHVDTRACPADIMLFGPNCGASSPLPQKYGLDNIEERIYNIPAGQENLGSRLFEAMSLNGGYIDLTPGEAGLELLINEFIAEHPCVGEAADSFEVGCNARYIHAAFLHTANTAAGGFLLPRGFWGRRALWFLMMMGTAEQRSMALTASYRALEEHRRLNTLSAEAARAMAAAVFDLV